MHVVRADRQSGTPDPGAMAADWLRGPEQDDGLDVAVVHFGTGAATPLHLHEGGQVLVALSGAGFIEVDGVRTELAAGDVAVAPAGEQHVHGALDGTSFSHLSVTTGRNHMLTDGAHYPE